MCAPTTDAKDEEVGLFYEQLQSAIYQAENQDLLIIMGDFNAKAGCEFENAVVGKYRFRERN